jgi:WD40 repeat protein
MTYVELVQVEWPLIVEHGHHRSPVIMTAKVEALQYKLFSRLEDEHSISVSISSVVFSPTGSYIACGGEDGKVSIWAPTGELLHVLTSASSILCLCWLATNQVLAGLAAGALACLTIDEVLSICVLRLHVAQDISPCRLQLN